MISWQAWGSTNKEIVTKFYTEAFINGNTDKAVTLLHKDYKQHNPKVKTGKIGFINAFKSFDTSVYNFEIKRAISEGDLVVLHIHVQNKIKKNDKDFGRAVIDIFRVNNGLITEHWDVGQKVPEITAHKNTMF
jgi:predicted SnoaL-like aldol condensation-catalyzing enzyme